MPGPKINDYDEWSLLENLFDETLVNHLSRRGYSDLYQMIFGDFDTAGSKIENLQSCLNLVMNRH